MKLIDNGDRNIVIVNITAASRRVVKASQRLPFYQLPPPVMMQQMQPWQ